MNCVICNASFFKDNLKYDIFYTFTTHTNTLCIDLIKKVLNFDINECQSRFLCQLCFGLLEELDYAQFTCTRLKKQLTERSLVNSYSIYYKECSTQTTDENIEENCKSDDLPNNILDVIKSEINLDILKDSDISLEQKVKYECDLCEKTFNSKSGLNLHTQKQHKAKKIDDSIKLEVDLELETSFKSDPESDSNDYETTTKSTKKTKQKTSKQKGLSNIKPLRYSCAQCPKMWRTLGELRSHVATHSSLRPFICEICGQAYKHKQALDIHIGMHNGINPFCCQYCNKAFTQKGALQRHLPIHTGEAPYQCDLCGKRFVHHTSFNMHTLAHTGQKSYKCDICGLALLSGSHLKRHMRVHTGERPYACQHCGKRFAERYNLAAHQKLHQAGSSEVSRQRCHRCQVCQATFDRRTKLEEHLSNNHNKIAETENDTKWMGHILNNS